MSFRFGMKMRITTAYHPQSNGLDELTNQTLKRSVLSCVCACKILNWIFEYMYNNTNWMYNNDIALHQSSDHFQNYGSDICLGEQISLGKCVQGHAFPGGTHITVTPSILFWILSEGFRLPRLACET